MICTATCGRCGQLVTVTSSGFFGVHFATVNDNRPCVGSYESAYKSCRQEKKEDGSEKRCN